MTWKMRPKKASLIASNDRKSSGRGSASCSHSSERAERGGSATPSSLSDGTPSAKRKPYCATHDSERRLSNAGKRLEWRQRAARARAGDASSRAAPP